MAKPGKTIVWLEFSPDTEWEDLSAEEQAIFIELATPDAETIAIAQSSVVPELKPFLDAELTEEIG